MPLLNFAAGGEMKTARDCVEDFWLLHFENYKKENQSIREYCREHGLKPSSFNDWNKKLKEKFPEKFETMGRKEICLLDQPHSGPKDDDLISSAFFEIKADMTESGPYEVQAREASTPIFVFKHKSYELQFSTYPRAEWLQNFIRGLE